ncbi:rRNA maturation RNase YbeY, partial [Patescibacteria group bacterium]|nr:rRNA maturation RNase YbeY [Patescibacteria group bacterium]
GIFLGEVIIDYAQIKRQAREFGSGVNDELVFILVHGLLHLLGYDDKTEKGAKEMERLGEKFILNFYDKN